MVHILRCLEIICSISQATILSHCWSLTSSIIPESWDMAQHTKHLGGLLAILTLVTTEVPTVPSGGNCQGWL